MKQSCCALVAIPGRAGGLLPPGELRLAQRIGRELPRTRPRPGGLWLLLRGLDRAHAHGALPGAHTESHLRDLEAGSSSKTIGNIKIRFAVPRRSGSKASPARDRREGGRPICYVLQRCGVVLRRSALVCARFATFCYDLVLFCCVMQRFGAVLLRFVLIGGSFAPLCINLGSFCCVLH